MQIYAAARTLKISDRQYSTPMIIPSFSSRAKPPMAVSAFLGQTLPAIVGPILLSAYDIGHQPQNCDFEIIDEVSRADLSFVLLDSGGYEVIWNERAVSAGLIKPNSAPEWSLDQYHAVLRNWPSTVPLLAVSWDASGTSIDHQVAAAKDLAARHQNHAVELLLKPPLGGFNLDEISNAADFFRQFPVLGITEVEIGATMAARLQFISDLRKTLTQCGLDTPIHIFGGLDPQMTPLYHAAGADIFDGLSWLRYAYHENRGIYDKSFVAVHYPTDIEGDRLQDMRTENIRHLVNLQLAMKKFQKAGNFDDLGPSGKILSKAWHECTQKA